MNEIPHFSKRIEEFNSMIKDAIKDYYWNTDEVNRLDKLTQDYLHKLELENLNYKERAKIATKLTKCRKLRRESKDRAEILLPLVNFLESDKGKTMMNLINETLGKTRKIEEKKENRTYKYKVLENAS